MLTWSAAPLVQDFSAELRQRLIPGDVGTVTASFLMGSLTGRTCHPIRNCAAPRNALVPRSFSSIKKRQIKRRVIHRSLAIPPSPPACRAATTTWCLNFVSESALV